MGLALLDVADAIRPHPEVVDLLRRGGSDDAFVDELRTVVGGEAARGALDAFLDRAVVLDVDALDAGRDDQVHAAVDPRGDRVALLPAAAGDPAGKCIPARGDRHDDEPRHPRRQRLDARTRPVRDHAAPGANLVGERGGQSVAVAVRLPGDQEAAVTLGLGERRVVHRVMTLAARVGGSGDRPRGEHPARIAGERRARAVDQRVLPDAARTDDEEEDARSHDGAPDA